MSNKKTFESQINNLLKKYLHYSKYEQQNQEDQYSCIKEDGTSIFRRNRKHQIISREVKFWFYNILLEIQRKLSFHDWNHLQLKITNDYSQPVINPELERFCWHPRDFKLLKEKLVSRLELEGFQWYIDYEKTIHILFAPLEFNRMTIYKNGFFQFNWNYKTE